MKRWLGIAITGVCLVIFTGLLLYLINYMSYLDIRSPYEGYELGYDDVFIKPEVYCSSNMRQEDIKKVDMVGELALDNRTYNHNQKTGKVTSKSSKKGILKKGRYDLGLRLNGQTENVLVSIHDTINPVFKQAYNEVMVLSVDDAKDYFIVDDWSENIELTILVQDKKATALAVDESGNYAESELTCKIVKDKKDTTHLPDKDERVYIHYETADSEEEYNNILNKAKDKQEKLKKAEEELKKKLFKDDDLYKKYKEEEDKRHQEIVDKIDKEKNSNNQTETEDRKDNEDNKPASKPEEKEDKKPNKSNEFNKPNTTDKKLATYKNENKNDQEKPATPTMPSQPNTNTEKPSKPACTDGPSQGYYRTETEASRDTPAGYRCMCLDKDDSHVICGVTYYKGIYKRIDLTEGEMRQLDEKLNSVKGNPFKFYIEDINNTDVIINESDYILNLKSLIEKKGYNVMGIDKIANYLKIRLNK